MLTGKERADLRGKANALETTLIVGKSGVTDAVIAETEILLNSHELVKGKVLEGALMTPREVSDMICEATGAEGIACLGSRFVIYRFSEKCQEARNAAGRAKRRPVPRSKADPVRKGIHARRQAQKKLKEERNAFFREKAIERSIEKSREAKYRGEN